MRVLTDENATPEDRLSVVSSNSIISVIRTREFGFEIEGKELGSTKKIEPKMPLHVAAKMGSPEAAQALVESGADPDGYIDGNIDIITTVAGHRETPLHMAAKHGSDQVASVLLDAGADPEVETYGNQDTPLHTAAREGNAGVVGVLMGANIDTRAARGLWAKVNESFNTPAEVAELNDHMSIAKKIRGGPSSDLDFTQG